MDRGYKTQTRLQDFPGAPPVQILRVKQVPFLAGSILFLNALYKHIVYIIMLSLCLFSSIFVLLPRMDLPLTLSGNTMFEFLSMQPENRIACLETFQRAIIGILTLMIKKLLI